MAAAASLTPAYDVVLSDPPTADDLLLDTSLQAFCDAHVPVESPAELRRRERVLAELGKIFRSWVTQVGVTDMKLPEETARAAGGRIYVGGSYRLRVHEPGADIDTVCVAPHFCTREHFFGTLKERLLAHPKVENLDARSTAAVPVMTFDFDTVNIDLLFASLPRNSVTEAVDIFDDAILRGVDEATEKSLNGPRVTNLIAELVPNFENFLVVLRCVRKWAKARGLYGNKFGYLGGVNFNVMVGMVCQLFPRASPSTLFHMFFQVYADWPWPSPVMLCETVTHDDMDFVVWTAQENKWDKMPIITPAYPAMNSSLSVNDHTLAVMQAEFARGCTIAEKVREIALAALKRGESAEAAAAAWNELFEPSPFFASYTHYLALNIVGSWTGFVESRIRFLPDILARQLPLKLVHLHPVKFSPGTVRVDADIAAAVAAATADGSDAAAAAAAAAARDPAAALSSVCYYVAFVIDRDLYGEDSLDIDYAVGEFMAKQLRKFKAPMTRDMAFVVHHFAWKDLPTAVFRSVGGRRAAKVLRKRLKGTSRADKEALGAGENKEGQNDEAPSKQAAEKGPDALKSAADVEESAEGVQADEPHPAPIGTKRPREEESQVNTTATGTAAAEQQDSDGDGKKSALAQKKSRFSSPNASEPGTASASAPAEGDATSTAAAPSTEPSSVQAATATAATAAATASATSSAYAGDDEDLLDLVPARTSGAVPVVSGLWDPRAQIPRKIILRLA